MNRKMMLATGVCLWSLVGLSACGSGGNSGNTDNKQQSLGSDGNNINDSASVGTITGIVNSEITDIKTCQLYLYDKDVSDFADDFDIKHSNFNMPDSGISGTAPIKFKNLTIAASESNKPSSIFTSIICAPPST